MKSSSLLRTTSLLQLAFVVVVVVIVRTGWAQETEASSSHTELSWTPTCSTTDSPYDYVGTLKFCQDGDIFGYRVNDDDPCGELSPLLRMTAGKAYKLRLQNQGNEDTNIHTHGLHIPGSGNGDDSTRTVGSGQWLIYNLSIPEIHMDGTYWYHSHIHTMSARQLGGGALGMLIIDPAESDKQQRPDWVNRDRKLLIADIISGTKVNGKIIERVELAAHRWHRLRVVFTAEPAFPESLRFDDLTCQVHTVAYDGVWRSVVPNPEEQYVFHVAEASRLDFAIKCSADSGLYYGEYEDNNDNKLLVNFVVVDSGTVDEGPPETWTPDRPRYLKDLRDVTGLEDNTFEVEVFNNNINGLVYDVLTPMEKFEYDSIQQWQVVGFGGHNLHLHVYHMQIVSDGGCGSFYEEGEFFDTFRPLGFDGCKVRFRMADVASRTIMHCHITQHADFGAINWVNVIGGPEPSFIDYDPKNTVSEPDEDTICPTESDTAAPTTTPTEVPTKEPRTTRTRKPTEVPTEKPTEVPTEKPTEAPTRKPVPEKDECDPEDDVPVMLYNADTNARIKPLRGVIRACDFVDVGLTVVAYSPCDQPVKFRLRRNGRTVLKRLEKVAPMSLGGDVGDDLRAVDKLKYPGVYTLSVNPRPGTKKTILFDVTDEC